MSSGCVQLKPHTLNKNRTEKGRLGSWFVIGRRDGNVSLGSVFGTGVSFGKAWIGGRGLVF